MSILDQPKVKIDDILIEVIPTAGDDLQPRLNNIKFILTEAEKTYKDKGAIAALNQISTVLRVGTVEAHELVKLYTQKLVPKRSKSRHFYDEILALGSISMCPYCNTKNATTLDHYLPKGLYPQYAITPVNLVPACRDCNSNKLDEVPQDSADLFLHPYFEDSPDFIWLIAFLQQTNPVSFKFDIDSSTSASPIILSKRLKKQFDCLKLALVYGAYSANEWSNIEYYISNLPDRNAISKYISDILLFSRKS